MSQVLRKIHINIHMLPACNSYFSNPNKWLWPWMYEVVAYTFLRLDFYLGKQMFRNQKGKYFS